MMTYRLRLVDRRCVITTSSRIFGKVNYGITQFIIYLLTHRTMVHFRERHRKHILNHLPFIRTTEVQCSTVLPNSWHAYLALLHRRSCLKAYSSINKLATNRRLDVPRTKYCCTSTKSSQ